MSPSSATKFNTKSPTIKRILKEASELSRAADPTLHACPLDSDLFEWHFTLQGPPSTPYAHGIYHGRIVLPATYPLRPPSFRFLTPSGRFEVNRELCLSISGHHEETWQPAWGIRTALWALRAFMAGDAKGQVGGMEMAAGERERLARESRRWSCAAGCCGGRTNEEVLLLLSSAGEGERGDGDRVGLPGGEPEFVPEELRFGFRDEMGNPEPGPDIPTAPGGRNGSLATPPNPAPSSASQPPPPPSLLPPQRASQPPLAPSSSSSSPPSESIPAWIDRTIVGLVAGLAVMVVRKVVF